MASSSVRDSPHIDDYQPSFDDVQNGLYPQHFQYQEHEMFQQQHQSFMHQQQPSFLQQLQPQHQRTFAQGERKVKSFGGATVAPPLPATNGSTTVASLHPANTGNTAVDETSSEGIS